MYTNLGANEPRTSWIDKPNLACGRPVRDDWFDGSWRQSPQTQRTLCEASAEGFIESMVCATGMRSDDPKFAQLVKEKTDGCVASLAQETRQVKTMIAVGAVAAVGTVLFLVLRK